MLGDPKVEAAFWRKMDEQGRVGKGDVLNVSMKKAIEIYKTAAAELGVEAQPLAHIEAARTGWAAINPFQRNHDILVFGSGTEDAIGALRSDVQKFAKSLEDQGLVPKGTVPDTLTKSLTLETNFTLQRILTVADNAVLDANAAKAAKTRDLQDFRDKEQTAKMVKALETQGFPDPAKGEQHAAPENLPDTRDLLDATRTRTADQPASGSPLDSPAVKADGFDVTPASVVAAQAPVKAKVTSITPGSDTAAAPSTVKAESSAGGAASVATDPTSTIKVDAMSMSPTLETPGPTPTIKVETPSITTASDTVAQTQTTQAEAGANQAPSDLFKTDSSNSQTRLSGQDHDKVRELNQIFDHPLRATGLRGGPSNDVVAPGDFNLEKVERALQLYKELGPETLRHAEISDTGALRVNGGLKALGLACLDTVDDRRDYGLDPKSPVVLDLAELKWDFQDNFKALIRERAIPLAEKSNFSLSHFKQFPEFMHIIDDRAETLERVGRAPASGKAITAPSTIAAPAPRKVEESREGAREAASAGEREGRGPAPRYPAGIKPMEVDGGRDR